MLNFIYLVIGLVCLAVLSQPLTEIVLQWNRKPCARHEWRRDERIGRLRCTKCRKLAL